MTETLEYLQYLGKEWGKGSIQPLNTCYTSFTTRSDIFVCFSGFKSASKLPQDQERNPGQSTFSVEGLTIHQTRAVPHFICH